MQNTGPDMECTGWINGFPKAIGGTGEEWKNCCKVHDMSEQTASAHFELAKCVASSGDGVAYEGMGVLMLIGLLAFNKLYMRIRYGKNRNDRTDKH